MADWTETEGTLWALPTLPPAPVADKGYAGPPIRAYCRRRGIRTVMTL